MVKASKKTGTVNNRPITDFFGQKSSKSPSSSSIASSSRQRQQRLTKNKSVTSGAGLDGFTVSSSLFLLSSHPAESSTLNSSSAKSTTQQSAVVNRRTSTPNANSSTSRTTKSKRNMSKTTITTETISSGSTKRKATALEKAVETSDGEESAIIIKRLSRPPTASGPQRDVVVNITRRRSRAHSTVVHAIPTTIRNPSTPSSSHGESSDGSRKKPRFTPPQELVSTPIEERYVPGSQSGEDEEMRDFMAESEEPSFFTKMNVDEGSSLECHLPEIDTGVSSRADLLTPPPTDDSVPPRIPSPFHMTAEDKTAQIIADIRARFNAIPSSRESSPLPDFKEELEESSDEDDDILAIRPLAKGEAKAEDPPPVSLAATPPADAPQYNLRARNSRRSSNKIPTTVVPSPAPKKKSTEFDKLIRSYEKDKKSGSGGEAFRRAQALLGKSQMLDEMDSDEKSLEDFSIEKFLANESRHGSPSGTLDSTDLSIDEEFVENILGKDNSAAIATVFQGDRAEQKMVFKKSKLFGVPFWRALSDEDIDTISQVPLIALGQHPLLDILRTMLESDELASANSLLKSSALYTLPLTGRPDIVAYLGHLAMHPRLDGAYLLLSNLLTNDGTPGLSFSLILSTFVRLGVQTSILEARHWSLPESVSMESMYTNSRTEIIFRLVSLLSLSGRRRKLITSEVPNIIVGLVLVGLDPMTTVDQQRDITFSINDICQCLSENEDILLEVESTICSKVLSIASVIEPANKSLLVSFFGDGTGRTSRIARWISYSIITKKDDVITQYTQFPPLEPLRDAVSGAGTCPPTNPFRCHEATDYEQMGYYMLILAVVLNDVRGYMVHDRRNGDILEAIRLHLEDIHARTSDTRAAHLERSRTKTIIKNLSMKIHYQRSATEKSRSATRPKNLQQYFTKNSNSQSKHIP